MGLVCRSLPSCDDGGMVEVVSVNIGAVEQLPHGRTTVSTAIRKLPVTGPVRITATAVVGDAQADAKHHGGPDKAVLVFSLDQYPTLERHIGREVAVPSFGENLTVTGASELDTCLGDTIRIGTALLQVSQPRNPCYKQAALHRVKDLVVHIERSGATGWYVRVLEPGLVTAGDEVVVVSRPYPGVTVAEVNRVLHPLDGGVVDLERIHRLLEVPELAANLRHHLERLAQGDVADPRSRRLGPPQA